MLKIDYQDKEDIKVLIRNVLDRLSKKLDPSVGRINYFLNVTNDRPEACAVISFDNNERVTDKNVKLINRELRETILKKYKIKFTVSCLVPKVCERYSGFTEKLVAYQETPVEISAIIERQILLEVLLKLVEGDPESIRAELEKAIHELLHLIYDKDHKFLPAMLKKIFTDLLWPDLDVAQARYPDQAGDMSRMNSGVVDYAHRVMHEVCEKLGDITSAIRRCQAEVPTVFQLISHFSATCEQLPLDHPKIAELIHLPITEESLSIIANIKQEAKRALSILTFDDDENSMALKHGFRTINLFDKLARFTGYTIEHSLVHTMVKIFGDEWFCFNYHEHPNFYQVMQNEFLERLISFTMMNTCLKSSKALYSQLEAILTVQHGQLSYKLRLQHEARLKIATSPRVVESRISAMRVNEHAPVSQPSSAVAPVSHCLKSNAKHESIKLSQQIEERKREKLLAKQSRIFSRIRLDSMNIENPQIQIPEAWFTLLLTMPYGESIEVDVSTLGLLNLESFYYRIDARNIILVKGSPIEGVIDENIRRILLSQDGRGFLPEISHGQVGVKLIKQAKREAFAVIKGRNEARIVCGRKRLILQDNETEFDIYVPLRLYPNHRDYEQFINQPNSAHCLRNELEKKLTIILMHFNAINRPSV